MVTRYVAIYTDANRTLREARKELEKYCEDGVRRLLGYGHEDLDLGSSLSRFFENSHSIQNRELTVVKTSRENRHFVATDKLNDPSEIPWHSYCISVLKETGRRIEESLGQYETTEKSTDTS